jgi:hypothetical protein
MCCTPGVFSIAGVKGCALTAFVDSWHIYLLIGNVLTYKHPLSATIRQLFHQAWMFEKTL